MTVMQQKLPHFHTFVEPAHDARGRRQERVLFAFRMPHLPDLLTSPHLSGQTDRERLVELFDRQVRLVSNLAKWQGCGLALRYWVRPGTGQVELILVGRAVAAAPGAAEGLARAVAHDVAALLQGYEFTVDPVTSEAELKSLLHPFEVRALMEIRQREEVVAMQAGDAYTVLPFAPSPSSTWIPVFEMLLRQQDDCLIHIYLEPTQLTFDEREALADAAAMAASLADFQYEGLSVRGRQVDPQAGLVARLYRRYLDRFTTPFQAVVQVLSPNPVVAHTAAQALGAEITETISPDTVLQDEARLPGGFDLVQPRTRQEWNAALRNAELLDLCPWGRSQASPGKERLVYLVDARTAAGAFRFPVPIKGGVPGIRTKQAMPQYHGASHSAVAGPDEIPIGRLCERDSLATVPLRQLARHVLVVGTNGSGKTTTCFQMLTQLWERGIPFLVIEPAKTEYRALVASPLKENLWVFTLGDESVAPFRFNPMEILPGVRVEAHISQLTACFEAALPTFGVLPSLIGESLERVYMEKGWNLTDRAQSDDQRLFPTLGDFYFEMIRTVESRDYSEKTLQDIRAAAAGRIGALLRGSKGRMLNTQRSIPMRDLMSRPTVLELESLNDEEKSLVMLFLLLAVREYCQTTRTTSALQHVTLVEEAHRVMAKTAHSGNREVSADSKAEAVAAFSAALSEIRAYGESMMIADQIPGRLVDDAMKNTNIKVVHRLPGADDRMAMAATMNMEQGQEAYVAKLRQGQAALFAEGYEKPVFIDVPNYRAANDLPERVPENQLADHMEAFARHHSSLFLPFPACIHCVRRCHYRDRVANFAYTVEAHKAFLKALYAYTAKLDIDEDGAWADLSAHCRGALESVGLARDQHAAYCYFAHHYGNKPSARAAQRLRGET